MTTQMHGGASLLRRICSTLIAAACAATLVAAQQSSRPYFRADDPIALDDDRARDAGGTARDKIGGWADFVLNTFFTTGEREPIPALNVNTLDEVPDSSWFTNRIGARPMSVNDIVRGPDRVERLAVGEWLIVEGKDSGRQPGFRAVDPNDPTRQIYQIEFDPRANPEMATGAEIIGTAVYHALGYNVVDVYLIDVDRASLRIDSGATITVNGRRRPFTQRDLKALLRGVARKADGSYRALASRFAEGTNVGPFRYFGTRPDDPNDIYAHEHRRELRGNRVFAAWLNHDDSRSINTLDMLVGPPGRQAIRHYMFDFGSILGSGTDGNDHGWVGHEYVVQGGPAWRTLMSLGLYRRPFIGADQPRNLPAAGSFTADRFEPARWRPHYPNPAFNNMRPDDAFWAARRLAALSPEAIAAIVRKAQYSDARVTDYVAGTLIRRRAAALTTWLTALNPVVSAAITDGCLQFENAAIAAGVATPDARYELAWFRFDNERAQHQFVGPRALADAPGAILPASLETGSDYIGVDVKTVHPDFPAWSAPVRFYFRRDGEGWTSVGVERTPTDRSEQAAKR